MTKALTVVIFLIVYALLVHRKGHPLLIVWSGAALVLAIGAITPLEAIHSINLNVVGILLGTMVLSEFFVDSKVPAFLAVELVKRAKSVAWALLSVCILSAAVSAVVDNVATVLMIAPIALAVSERLKVSPVPFVAGIAVSANLEGAATMIGDSTSILLASEGNMTFADFFWTHGKPGIFFAVQVGALFSFCVLYMIFRRQKGSMVPVELVVVTSWVPTILMTLMIATLTLSSFIPNRPDYAPGLIAIIYGAIALIWNAFARQKQVNLIKSIDWVTIFLLCGLFVLIGSLTTVGVIRDIASVISRWTRGNSFLAYNVLVWLSVLLSAFIDNIPYTMAMLPVARLVADSMGVSPYVMMFGLILGTTLGGNITPIGASANVVAVSILRKRGEHVSFVDFAKVGLPFTLTAVISASMFVWLIWH